MNTLSWKPVRQGERYCSPACGFGCSHLAYETATKKAAALAKSLGSGWKPIVSENLGWHSKATKGDCHVHHIGYRHYWAELRFGGRQFHATGTTPRIAVEQALDEATIFSIRLKNDIREFYHDA